MPDFVGYSALIEAYSLRTLPLAARSRIDARVKGYQRQQTGGQWFELFEPSYQPDSSMAGQLQFVLRYEGINLHSCSTRNKMPLKRLYSRNQLSAGI